MGKIWVTSDTHFGHDKIRGYCSRPFKDVEDMNKVMIRNWNQRVKPEDTIFFLGDFCFKRSTEAPTGEPFQHYSSQLKGNIIYIKGNHDRNNGSKSRISSIHLEYAGKTIRLMHDPRFADPKFDYNFCGHVHEKWQFRKTAMGFGIANLINVGVDVNKFMPITIDEAISKFKHWEKEKEMADAVNGCL